MGFLSCSPMRRPLFSLVQLYFPPPGFWCSCRSGRACRQPSLSALAVTLLIFLGGSVVADAAGVPWSPATAALTAVPPVLAAWLAGRRFSFRTPLWPGNLGLPAKLAVGAGVAFGSLVTCLALLRGIGDPATASQGWDPIFHLNVLTWIQESGSASPPGVAPIFGASRSTYYPAGWHSAVSLVPGGVTEAANLSSIVIGGRPLLAGRPDVPWRPRSFRGTQWHGR